MKRIVLFSCVAAVLAGCASTSPNPAPASTPVFASPTERAYQLGVEHRMVQDCREELGSTQVAQHTDSAQLLLASYPKEWREAARVAYSRGFQAGPERFHRIPCEDIQQLLADELTCNSAETRRNLKTAAHLN